MTESKYGHPVEEELLDLILSKKDTLKGNPHAILAEIDEFGKKKRIMNVGPHKGEYLIDEVRKHKPNVIYEFGTHTGYSSIMMAAELEETRDENAKIHTFDMDEGFFKISEQIIALSGLSHRIYQHLGKVNEIVEKVSNDEGISRVDLVFLDHWKDSYISDLRLLETVGLVTKGTVVCADNVIIPGAPDYLEYVRSPPIWKRNYNQKTKNPVGSKYVGRWGLIYESTIHKAKTGGGDMDGLEVTKCVGILDG
ncbi:CYFA0S15e00254g1_1 [Cyberlindnera fabianii]|uniref:catechol O-methyltransferase n=1 Tax=Cyberlindnera fabianii TaxID=36022 RepID=A0A061B3V1_CYBFA|nr:CYFA0S15e00254g1_1 [Cyberlindnera fabianii]